MGSTTALGPTRAAVLLLQRPTVRVCAQRNASPSGRLRPRARIPLCPPRNGAWAGVPSPGASVCPSMSARMSKERGRAQGRNGCGNNAQRPALLLWVPRTRTYGVVAAATRSQGEPYARAKLGVHREPARVGRGPGGDTGRSRPAMRGPKAGAPSFRVRLTWDSCGGVQTAVGT
jgi:hypothetical protein